MATTGTGYAGGHDSSGQFLPTLDDLLNSPMNNILSRMGYTQEELSDYSYMFPEYDPYDANVALDRYNLENESFDLKSDSLQNQREDANEMFQLSKTSADTSLYDIAASGEAAGYEVFSGNQNIMSSGLGQGGRFRSRALKQAQAKSDTASSQVAADMASKEIQYEASLEQIENDLAQLEIGRQESLINYDERVQSTEKEFETEFWDFVSFLGENNVDFDD